MGEPLHHSVCTWTSLEGAIAPEIVQAPKTGGDEQGAWVEVSERVVRYLQHSVVGSPWANHLALVAAVMSARPIGQTRGLQASYALQSRVPRTGLALHG